MYLICPNGHCTGKDWNSLCLVSTLSASGCSQVAIKQLFFDENMTELIVQEIPFWGNGTGSNGEMPLIPPKQSF